MRTSGLLMRNMPNVPGKNSAALSDNPIQASEMMRRTSRTRSSRCWQLSQHCEDRQEPDHRQK